MWNFVQLTRKCPCGGPFHNKVARFSNFVKKDSSTGGFFLWIYEIWSNTSSIQHLRWVLLFTRVSAEEVTNCLFDHAEYEYNSDQTQWNTRAFCYE